MDISRNAKFTILTVACLCSCENVEILVAHGHEFSSEELLSPVKTLNQFPAELWNWKPTMGRGRYVMITFADKSCSETICVSELR